MRVRAGVGVGMLSGRGGKFLGLLVSWCLGFSVFFSFCGVSLFQSSKVSKCRRLKDSISKFPFHAFLEDVDPIFNMFKKIQDGSS